MEASGNATTQERSAPGRRQWFRAARRAAGGSQLLTDAVTVSEAENAFHLVEGDVLLNLHHVLVEAWTRPAHTIRIKPQVYGVSCHQGQGSRR